MLSILDRDVQEEAELVERFVRGCRPRFAAAIAMLNRRRVAIKELEPELQSLRLCVEAMDMILSNQDRMARMLRRLHSGSASALKAA